jgi:hypothetical protein
VPITKYDKNSLCPYQFLKTNLKRIEFLESSTPCTKERDTFKKCAETLMPELAKELGGKKQLSAVKSKAADVPNKTKVAAVQSKSKKAVPKAAAKNSKNSKRN